jgi:hypothetical protein
MTSSVTSTEKGLARRGPNEPPAPGKGPSEGPLERKHGLSPALTRKLAVAAFVWLPAIGLVAALYGGHLTVGALFLALGWVSFAAAAWQIGRAALAFDVGEVDPHAYEGTIDEERRAELLREKKVLLKAIKEIEFDHEMGKMDDQDAAHVTRTYRVRALEIMRLLDENKSVDYGAIVEKELAKRLAKAGGLAPKSKELPAAKAEPQAEPAASEPAVEAKAKGTCGECGTKNDEDAVFCKKCAARLVP